MLRFVRRGKIPFVSLFCIHQRNRHERFNSEKVLLLKKLIICEDNNKNSEASVKTMFMT